MPSAAQMSEVVRRAYDAFNRGDVDALYELCAPEVQIHDLPSMPEQEVFRGQDGVERYFNSNWDTFEDVWGDVEQILEAGPDRVLALTRHGGTARGGPRIAQARGVLVTFSEHGKMREIRFFAEPREALAAAGLDEHTAA
jgi:ketosteroid isomerase-like protein